MSSTSQKENDINFGDKRLSKRYKKITEKLLEQPTSSIPATFKNWHQTKAAYRFFSNPKVTFEKILESQYTQSTQNIQNIEQEKDILIIQDTTHLNYNGHENKKELCATHSYVSKGLHLHPSVAMTPDKINIGLVDITIWTKEKNDNSKSNHEKKKRPIEEKASYRWIKSLKKTKELAKKFPDKMIFNIADREGDIYDLFLEGLEKSTENSFFIVRSAQNRLTKTNERKLKETMENAPQVGEASFKYQNKTVKQIIKAESIELDSPKHRPHLSPLKLNVVLAQEQKPYKAQAPIEWLILTNYPIKTADDAKKILHYYTKRWEIETFFKVLKSGCKVEEIRLEKLERLEKALSLYIAIACKIMFIVNLGRIYPDISCEMVFSDFEWKSVYLAINRTKIPPSPPSLKEIIICIAQLGGYLNRKSDPPPGPKAMWIGLQQMRFLAMGFELSSIYG